MIAIDYRLPAAYDYSYPNISINMQYSLGSPVTLVRLALFCSLPLGHPSQGRGTHGKNAPRAPFDTDIHIRTASQQIRSSQPQRAPKTY